MAVELLDRNSVFFAQLTLTDRPIMWLSLALVLGTVVALEGVAWLVHRYLLHGPLWFLHRTHHEPQPTWFEANDLVAVAYAVLSAGLVIWGDLNAHWAREIGFGILVYGVLYAVLHDVIVHQRLPLPRPLRTWLLHQRGYLRRLIRAHKIHHKHLGRLGGQAFGFLYASRRYAD